MSYTYRNLNTGDLHEADERDTRLDNLDNWQLIAPGDDEVCSACGRAPELVGDGILSREGMRPTEVFSSAPVVQVDSDGAVKRPTDRASRAAWVAYAVGTGKAGDDVNDLTRDDLVARYGA